MNELKCKMSPDYNKVIHGDFSKLFGPNMNAFHRLSRGIENALTKPIDNIPFNIGKKSIVFSLTFEEGVFCLMIKVSGWVANYKNLKQIMFFGYGS